MKYRYLFILGTLLLLSCSVSRRGGEPALQDGEHTLDLLTTNDVHGAWFSEPYTGGRARKSLMSVKFYADSVRKADGRDNVILLDAGDCLQGDNAAYYFNYVDTLTPHLYPRIARYMGYDAIVVGNHDIETGHKVYDRVAADFRSYGIPFLAGNAIRNDDGKPYFFPYTILHKAGLKVAVLGYDNANIKAWLNESLWSGMHFENLIPLVKNDVAKVKAAEKPDVTIVAVHSGFGDGDGKILESQGLDLYCDLEGVDFLVCSHDHRPITVETDSICLINAGSRAGNVGLGKLKVKVENGKIVSKTLSATLIDVDTTVAVKKMGRAFKKDYKAVKAFTIKPVGELKQDLFTREAFAGMCPYMNLIHTLSITCSPAQISFAAPLSANGHIKAGTLIFNDLFTLYPYENQLFVVRMSGSEIKNYLEYSYDSWIQTAQSAEDHVLRIDKRPDRRSGADRWGLTRASFNFDSAAGINYTVDVTKPMGQRICISSLASGEAFDLSKTYNVAMTSYRASGGGGLMSKGAGIDTDRIEDRVVEKYPEIRNLLYDYLQSHGSIDPEALASPSLLGSWRFIPDDLAPQAVRRDMDLMFKR